MEKESNQTEVLKNKIEDSETTAVKSFNSCNDDLNSKKKSKKRERSPSFPSQIETRCQSYLISDRSLQNNTNSSNVISVNQPVKKEKQKPETWNKIEQQIFFNALRQNGKNFESITQCFNARQKKYKINDGAGVQRSKEQIRHFYYRTWHKIIKYISLPVSASNACDNLNDNEDFLNGKIVINTSDCSVRDMQVKCLIAYNALINKSYRWNKKTAIKLVELINHGWTTVREKGKITRLRMPICKITGKAQNDIESNVSSNSNTVPSTLSVFLEPNSESAYCRVHKLAQNPFLNIEVNSSQTIKFLIDFLENKWKNRRNQFIEKFRTESHIKNSKSNTQDMSSMTDSDDTDSQSKPRNKNYLNDIKQKILYLENLVIYPQDLHPLKETLIEQKSKCSPLNEQKTSSTPNSSQLMNDDPMIIDECAIDQENFLASKKTYDKTETEEENKKSGFELNIDQIRTGLTCKNCFIDFNGKEKKEITFSKLYLASNKPGVLKFKYDWIIEKEDSILINSTSNSNAALPSSLKNKQNAQQRFYIDTLASVAASFLKENAKSKEAPSQAKTSQESKIQTTNQIFKSPTQPVGSTSPSIAVIQPNTSIKQAIAVPIENVLQTLNEQQANKTRKLLADLPKRRSRQRKPIMVVNSSHTQRPMLPKINMNHINNETETSGQQNIVFSGPMAAVARQIVNRSDDLNDQNKSTLSSRVVNEEPNQVVQSLQSNNLIHSSLQQNYSNLIPRILNNLIDGQNEESNNKCQDEQEKCQEIGSPQNLTSMSLLELSINNADSLFGSSVIRVKDGDDKNAENISEQESSSKSKDGDQINFNEMNNLSSILNSIVSQQASASNYGESSNFIRFNSNNPSLNDVNNRKSDIVVEWTDSMNDVSLSGCFFADLQTTESKDTKKSAITETSRDSFFFNMDSMMEILPTSVNRFDESSLLNNSMNTVDNITGKNLNE